MCTSISFKTKDHYFGRNLDLEYSYREAVTITPRNFSFQFQDTRTFRQHYAIIGMATVANDYPLYYDATNECGLSIAGLNFPENAVYLPATDGKDNVAPFELIPWILGQCGNIGEARERLERINLVNIAYDEKYPLTPLHWMISDKNQTIVAEPTADGVQIHENPVGVLTNNPPFPYHIWNLNNYMSLTSSEPVNRFSNKITLEPYSRGMGGLGLPGDLSSASRFVRAAFTKLNSVCDDTENESISQFFHILDAVAQTRGCARVEDGYEITLYSSCCNTDRGIYYYKTYENSQLTAVNLHHETLSGSELIQYPLRIKGKVLLEN